jgi:hypothetical protein
VSRVPSIQVRWIAAVAVSLMEMVRCRINTIYCEVPRRKTFKKEMTINQLN